MAYAVEMCTKAFNSLISRHKCMIDFVPVTLMPIANLSFSSKRTVAATWKTTLTLFFKTARSATSIPKSGRTQSPVIPTTWWRNFGLSAFNFSKSWKKDI